MSAILRALVRRRTRRSKQPPTGVSLEIVAFMLTAGPPPLPGKTVVPPASSLRTSRATPFCLNHRRSLIAGPAGIRTAKVRALVFLPFGQGRNLFRVQLSWLPADLPQRLLIIRRGLLLAPVPVTL